MQRNHAAILLCFLSVLFAVAVRGAFEIGWVGLDFIQDVSAWGMIGTAISAVVVFSFFHDWHAGKNGEGTKVGAGGVAGAVRAAMLAVALPWALFINYMVLIGMLTRCMAVSVGGCTLESQMSFLGVAAAIGSASFLVYLVWIRTRRSE